MTLSALLKILSFSSPSPPSNYLVWTSNYWITRLCRALVLAVTLWETPSKEDTRFETVFNCRCRSFTPKTQDQYKMHVKSVQYSAHKGCGFGELEKSQRKDETCGFMQQGPAVFTPQPERHSRDRPPWAGTPGECWPVIELTLTEPLGPSLNLTSKLGTDKRYLRLYI